MVGLQKSEASGNKREATARVDEAGQSETLLDWREGEMPRWINCLVSVSGVVERGTLGYGTLVARADKTTGCESK